MIVKPVHECSKIPSRMEHTICTTPHHVSCLGNTHRQHVRLASAYKMEAPMRHARCRACSARQPTLAAEAGQFSTASRRGQDERGRRRSATIPPNELSRENVGQVAKCGNMLQHVSNCKMLQTVATCGNVCALKTDYGKMCGLCGPSAETLFVPDPVRKPVIEKRRQRRFRSGEAHQTIIKRRGRMSQSKEKAIKQNNLHLENGDFGTSHLRPQWTPCCGIACYTIVDHVM